MKEIQLSNGVAILLVAFYTTTQTALWSQYFERCFTGELSHFLHGFKYGRAVSLVYIYQRTSQPM